VKTKYQLHHVCLSVHMEQLGSHLTVFHEIRHLSIFENCPKNSRFIKNQTRITATLHEDQCAFFLSYHAHFFSE